MEVDFAFLADAAEAVGGKLYVVGGSIDTIWAADVPLSYPRLSFVVRLFFTPAEIGRSHKVEINILTEDGKRLATVGGDLSIGKNPNLPAGWKQGYLSVLNFANLKFENFGDYSFELVINHSSLKSVLLRIARRIDIQP